MKPPELFAITNPVPFPGMPDGEPEFMTPEESIVYMARVSSPNQRTEDAEKLLTYLVKHGHWSPFDMVDMTIKLETSRAIMAQILRHWSFRFQEFSQRYASVTDFDYKHVELRFVAAEGNRQGSSEVSDAPMGMTHEGQQMCKAAARNYQSLIDRDIAPECARMVLPLATLTHAYMKGSVRSWMTYFWQRLDPHAQKEHRLLAEQMFTIFEREFPVIASLVKKYKPSIIEQP